jgi:hypothetical protein
MYVLLPKSSLDNLVNQLTPDNWIQFHRISRIIVPANM